MFSKFGFDTYKAGQIMDILKTNTKNPYKAILKESRMLVLLNLITTLNMVEFLKSIQNLLNKTYKKFKRICNQRLKNMVSQSATFLTGYGSRCFNGL